MVPGSEGSEKSTVGEDSASPDQEDPTMVSNDFEYVSGLPSPRASGNWGYSTILQLRLSIWVAQLTAVGRMEGLRRQF